MLCYWFRLADREGVDGYYGLAVAENWEELFWEIDQFADPYQVQIKPVGKRGGSFCTLFKNFEDSDECDFVETEICNHIPVFDKKGWKTVDWGKAKKLYR